MHVRHRCYRSKWRAVIGAALDNRPRDRVLLWHLGMLKLLPLLRAGQCRIYQFLHGVECWRPLDAATLRMLDRVDVFLTNSEFTWEHFLEVHPQVRRRRHHTVALGLGADGQPAPPPQVRAAVIAGRMDRNEDYKGHRQLIAVWPELVRRIPDAELWVIGEGNLRTDLEALARSGPCSERIRFFGGVTEAEKNDLLQRAACLVMPSRGEGFGLAYLEAMRFGRPCLVSLHDAGREVVGPPEAGLAVDPDNPIALAAATERLLQNGPEWRAWSEGALRRYTSCFTARHFQERLSEALSN
jgi:phosphatidylinositol alpha-1,6-mannosyltransferase